MSARHTSSSGSVDELEEGFPYDCLSFAAIEGSDSYSQSGSKSSSQSYSPKSVSASLSPSQSKIISKIFADIVISFLRLRPSASHFLEEVFSKSKNGNEIPFFVLNQQFYLVPNAFSIIFLTTKAKR